MGQLSLPLRRPSEVLGRRSAQSERTSWCLVRALSSLPPSRSTPYSAQRMNSTAACAISGRVYDQNVKHLGGVREHVLVLCRIPDKHFASSR